MAAPFSDVSEFGSEERIDVLALSSAVVADVKDVRDRDRESGGI